jgi:hypothetical protein
MSVKPCLSAQEQNSPVNCLFLYWLLTVNSTRCCILCFCAGLRIQGLSALTWRQLWYSAGRDLNIVGLNLSRVEKRFGKGEGKFRGKKKDDDKVS